MTTTATTRVRAFTGNQPLHLPLRGVCSDLNKGLRQGVGIRWRTMGKVRYDYCFSNRMRAVRGCARLSSFASGLSEVGRCRIALLVTALSMQTMDTASHLRVSGVLRETVLLDDILCSVLAGCTQGSSDPQLAFVRALLKLGDERIDGVLLHLCQADSGLNAGVGRRSRSSRGFPAGACRPR